MQYLKGVAEYFTPVLGSSQFQEKGVLTPEEFVIAGDQLCYKCPTWSWGRGDPSKNKTYLPPDKQFLITRNVPCVRRKDALNYSGKDETLLEDDWLATHINQEFQADGDIPTIPGASPSGPQEPTAEVNIESFIQPSHGADDVPDISDFEEDNNIVQEDSGALDTAPYIVRNEPEDNIMRTRTYDVTITYDKYYQTPRIWLFGYDENRQPLRPEQVFEDVSQDHAKKTVTLEPHPHLGGIAHASVHPCRHAPTMKRIIDYLTAEGKQVRVDQYMFLFLKFISCVVPTIEYDYTIESDA